MEQRDRIDLDILGQVCPACLLVALKQINIFRDQLKKGQAELVIRTDHRDATRTIPESVKAMGYEVEVLKVASHYEIKVSKKA